jgi:hypothetical protein
MGVEVGTLAVTTKAENAGHNHIYSHATMKEKNGGHDCMYSHAPEEGDEAIVNKYDSE